MEAPINVFSGAALFSGNGAFGPGGGGGGGADKGGEAVSDKGDALPMGGLAALAKKAWDVARDPKAALAAASAFTKGVPAKLNGFLGGTVARVGAGLYAAHSVFKTGCKIADGTAEAKDIGHTTFDAVGFTPVGATVIIGDTIGTAIGQQVVGRGVGWAAEKMGFTGVAEYMNRVVEEPDSGIRGVFGAGAGAVALGADMVSGARIGMRMEDATQKRQAALATKLDDLKEKDPAAYAARKEAVLAKVAALKDTDPEGYKRAVDSPAYKQFNADDEKSGSSVAKTADRAAAPKVSFDTKEAALAGRSTLPVGNAAEQVKTEDRTI